MNFDVHLFFQRVMFIVAHYGWPWIALNCAIAAVISWKLCTLFTRQNNVSEAHIAWWSTLITASLAVVLFLSTIFT